MAFREIRFNFKDVTDQARSKELNVEVGGPFEWVLDGVMRGSFKLYSGSEVKGVNIVNLICHSEASANEIKKTSPVWQPNVWKTGINTYDCIIVKDFNIFSGSRPDKIKLAIEIFLEMAKVSELPQMVTLIEQMNLKVSDALIKKAIIKADKAWKEVLENAWKYEKLLADAKKWT